MGPLNILLYWKYLPIHPIRTLIINDIAIEIKSTDRVVDKHLKGLRAFKEEHDSKGILVSRDPRPRKTPDDILILPWQDFLERLWSGEIID
jgi:predicted AAA+ superfamily ATPase